MPRFMAIAAAHLKGEESWDSVAQLSFGAKALPRQDRSARCRHMNNPAGSILFSLIVPAYNEELRIGKSLEQILPFCNALGAP